MKFADLELKFASNFDRLNSTIDQINKRLEKGEKQAADAGKAAERSANSVASSIAKLGKSAAAATVAITGVFAGFVAIKSTITGLDAAAEKINNLGKVAKQLQIPIEQLSVLRFAAGESGVEFETLSKMAAKASKNLAELLSDGKTVLPIGRMNVKLTDSAGQLRSITDVLPEIATGIERLGSAGAKIDVASKIFGKEGGAEFVKFLADGGNFVKNMADQTDRARRLGVIFTDDQVRKLTAYKDAVGRVEEAFLGLKVSVMTEVAPVLTEVANRLALQMGGIPGQIRSAGNAWRLANAGIPLLSEIADQDLQDLKARVSDVFVTTMAETGKVFGEVALSTMANGMTILGPPLHDLILDYIAPVLINPIAKITPGMDELQKSLKSQLEDARAMITPRRNLTDEREAIFNKLIAGGASFPERVELQYRVKEINKILEGYEDELAKRQAKVSDLENQIAAQTARRNADIAAVLNASVEQTGRSIERAKAKIGSSWDALQEQQERMLVAYGPQQAALAGPGPSGSFPIIEVFDSLGAAWDGFTARLEAVEPKLAKVGEKVLGHIAAIQGFRQDLGVRARRASASIAGLPDESDREKLLGGFADQVDALVKKLGPDSQLISELRAVQDIEIQAFDAERVRKVNADTEQWVKSLRRAVDPASDTREQIELIVANYATGVIDFELYSKAMDLYVGKLNQVRSVGEKFGDTMSDAIKGFSDDATRAFSDFALEAKGSFAETANAFGRMLFETATKALIFKPIFDSLGVAFGGWLGGSKSNSNPTGWQGPPQSDGSWAKGGAFERGWPIAFASGGIVSGPTLFPMSGRRTGLMGEAGPEAIMPLQRIGGDLGVRATGGGVTVQIIDQRGSGERPQVSESTGPDGRRMIQVLIRDQVKAAFSEGSMDTLMGRMYGLRRAGT
jgi:hypothetical protein